MSTAFSSVVNHHHIYRLQDGLSALSCLQTKPTDSSLCLQDALIDMVRRSKVHFVHCLLPKGESVGGSDPRVPHGESSDSGLMTLDVGLLRAQLRGSKLLDALRIYRQGEVFWHLHDGIYHTVETGANTILVYLVVEITASVMKLLTQPW